MKLKHGIVGALISAVGLSTAQAAENPIYIGIGFGQSNFDSGVSNLTGTAKLDDTDTGFKLFAGYQFNNYFSLEGHYADFGEASLTGNTGDTFVIDGTTYAFTANNVSVKSEPTSLGLSAVLRYPVTQSIEPFAKVGIHSWDVDGAVTSTAGNVTTSDSGADALFGIGVNVAITDSLSARLEAERYNFDDDDLDFISIGLQYNF